MATHNQNKPTAMREWDRAWMDADVGSVSWYTALSTTDASISVTAPNTPTNDISSVCGSEGEGNPRLQGCTRRCVVSHPRKDGHTTKKSWPAVHQPQ